MPFIKGQDLCKLKPGTSRIEEQLVKFYASQIVLAVGDLHSKQIVHRDLKLENIMLDETGYIKIIDFGLSKQLPAQQMANSLKGTPYYIAPELLYENP